MITEEEFLEVVKGKIKELFSIEETILRRETILSDNLGLDSLDKLELLLSLETDYNVVGPTFTEEKWETVQDIIDTFLPLINVE